jgi:hypothetical protein
MICVVYLREKRKAHINLTKEHTYSEPFYKRNGMGACIAF